MTDRHAPLLETSTHNMTEQMTLPILDVPLLFDTSLDGHAAEKATLHHAIHDVGFLVLRNHPIVTADKIMDILAQYRRFFKSPLPIKQAVNMQQKESNRGWGAPEIEQVNPDHLPDYKEIFDCGLREPNLWPDLPDFKPAILDYFTQTSDIALKLLLLIADIINYPVDHFQSAFANPMSLLRGNYYPARTTAIDSNQYGIAPHTDYGCLTLLSSDTVDGLDIQTRDGQWRSVHIAKGDIVINFGEMLEKWTNGLVRATPHRVIGSAQERLSCVLFFNPEANTNIAPRDSSHTELAGTYLMARYRETYLHLVDNAS